MSSVGRSIYRTLLKRTRTFDRHRPLKLLIPPFNSECNSFIHSAFAFYSIRHEPQLYDSSHSIKQHIRTLFDFIKFINTNPNHKHVIATNENYSKEIYLTQLGFDIIKIFSTTAQLIDYIEYDIKYIESLPQNNIIPPRLSDPIQQALAKADETTTNNINEACMFIKLANACEKIEDRISYYAKSINAYETADGYTYLGWMLYTLSANNKGNKDILDTKINESDKLKMSPLSSQDAVSNDKEIKEEILEYIMNDNYLSKLNDIDGMMLMMKCDRIACLLDPSFGNAWNDLGVCIMNQLFMSDQSDKALELFARSKQCLRYSSREFPFVNAARLYLRHKKDVKKAIKEYLGALYFNRDEMEPITAIKEYRALLLKSMERDQLLSNCTKDPL